MSRKSTFYEKRQISRNYMEIKSEFFGGKSDFLGERAGHELVRDAGFGEDVAEGFEAEMTIEWDGLLLGMKAESVGTLTLGFSHDLKQKDATEAFAAVGGEHSTDAHNAIFLVGKQTSVGNDLTFAAQTDVGGSEIDAILIEVADALFEDKDAETRFEDLVEFGG